MVMARRMIRYSGIQKEVLALYAEFVRAIKKKPAPQSHSLLQYVRAQFKANAKSVAPRDVALIENMVRRGKRQLSLLQGSETDGFSMLDVNNVTPPK